ncbi:MAG: sugar kinase [Rhodobacteraceae bacterium]|nr:sugar kinase [Paracoccaceae bacterium]
MTDLTEITSIACIGEVMIELVPEEGDSLRMGVAGDSFNTAVYLKRVLGESRQTSFVTALGNDPFSDRIVTEMEGHELDTGSLSRRDDKMPGLYAISTDPAGERSFSYWRSDSAARTLFAEPYAEELDRLQNFDLVLLTGITMAILPQDTRNRLIDALDRFRAAGGRVAYDSNHRPKLWESRKTAQDINRAMWQRADIALPSLDDEQAIYGDPSEDAVVARLSDLGCQDGALKRGAQGPRALDPDVAVQSFAPAPRVVDTTAAGDSFNAGFLGARLTGADIATALQQGHTLASRVIGAKGAILPE